MAVGRISGPLLKSNLLRSGVNLAFENDLLVLDVNNDKVGIKLGLNNGDQNDPILPQHELDVNGTSKTTNLIVDVQADLADITISGNTIQSSSDLNLVTIGADTVVYQKQLDIQDISIYDNIISTNNGNVNLELRPNGTGIVDIFSEVNVTGNIHATGNITADGNIQLGSTDQTTPNDDTVTFNAEIASDLIPDADNTYQLGTAAKRWSDIYVQNFVATEIDTGDLFVDGIDLSLRQGKIIYVATNGDDTNTGTHPQDPVASLKYAIETIANTGDSIHIYPGTYTETFPIEIPVGVNVKGESLRSVKVQPTVASQDKDAFLLNGETTIEDITVANYFYNSTNNTGYAFRFASNIEVTSRSPYIKNVTVITEGSVTSAADPRGFDQGDAGKGVFVDGSDATANSKEASMLFHSVTFICPGVDAVTATNGARIEWLNSFTYFANRSMYAYDSAAGLRGDGKTAIRVDDVIGSFSAGETVTYYDIDGTTVLASGTIETVDADGKFYIDTKNTGWELPSERGGKTVAVNGDAQLSSSISKFGIGSLLLDGTGDYITVSSQDDFEYGTGDFTIEFYVYFDAVSGNLYDQRTTASQASPVIYVNGSSKIAYYVNGAEVITGTTTPATSTWYHVAVTREGTNTKLFINGTQEGSTWTDNTTYVETGIRIGAGFNDTSFVDGNFDEVRVVKGEAKYTTNFTPSTLPFVGEDGTILLLHFEGLDGSTDIVDDGISGQDIRFSGGATASKTTLVDLSDFGAEIRLIGSASVYGNEGLVGDGPGVVMYAIGHNVAYIGNGKDVDNDPNTVIQANEIVETNDAKVYYSTVDHKGDFRVGDLFVIDQENGAIQFSNASFNIDTTNGIEITDGTNTTLIRGDKIETGNWRLSNNTLETLSGDANITAASGQINLQDNVDITGDLDVVGNVTVAGNITIGDQSTDSISFAANIDSGMFPTTSDTYDLGSPSLRWRDLWSNRLYVDDIEINDNYITTTGTNADLELRANGAGVVRVPSNNVIISNDLTVNGNTILDDVTINSDFDVTGTVTITGDTDITGDVTIGQNLTVSETAQFEEILIDDNFITTTTTSADLELRAAGTGSVVIPNNNLEITNNLNVGIKLTSQNIDVIGNIQSASISSSDINIVNNTITTTQTSSNLVLRASGAGEIHVDTNDVVFGQTLTVAGATDVQDLTVNGTITHTGDYTQTGNTNITGNLDVFGTVTFDSEVQFEEILINDNFITTTSTSADLELRAAGTGRVLIPNNQVVIENDLDVTNNITANNIDVTVDVTAPTFNISDIQITGNEIATTVLSTDLDLVANGTGEIVFNSKGVFNQGLTVASGTTNLLNTTIVGQLSHAGDATYTGDALTTGNYIINGALTLTGGSAVIDDILIDTNFITTNITNADLELRADGNGIVRIQDRLEVTNDLTVNGTLSTPVLDVTTTITSDIFSTGDIEIQDNVITTTNTNNDLELRANALAFVRVDQNNVVMNQELEVVGATRLQNTTVSGSLTHIGQTNQTGDFDLTGNLNVTGDLDISGAAQFEEILIDDNKITTTSTNADLELSASGTGNVLINNAAVFEQNIEIEASNTLQAGTINVGTVLTPSLTISDEIEIAGNVIRAVQSNSDLVIDASGTGSVLIPNSNVSITNDLTVSGLTTLDNTVITGDITHTGNYAQSGDAVINGNYTVNGLFSVNAEMQFENILINDNFITTTVTSSDLELRAAGTGKVLVPNNDVLINNNLEILGITTTENINNTGLITSGSFETAKIRIINNLVKTILPGDDLIIEANGTGTINVDSDLTVTNDFAVTGETTLQETSITGTLTQQGGTVQSGNFDLTGNLQVVGDLTALSSAQFEEILIDDNFITTTNTSADLELRANGLGEVLIPLNDVVITDNLTVNGVITSGSIVNSGQIISDSFGTGDILIDDNTITTSVTSSNLELRASGTGEIKVPTSNVEITNDLTVIGSTTTADVNVTGQITHVGNTIQTGDYTVNGGVVLTGQLNVTGTSTLDNMVFSNNVISIDPNSTNTDLILRPNTGNEVIIDQNDLSVTGDILAQTSTINSDTINNTFSVSASTFSTGTISIIGNYITSSADIILEANPGDAVRIETADVEFGEDLTILGTTTLNDLNVNGTITHIGDYTQTGDTTINGNIIVGGNFDVSGAFQFEEILIDDNIITTTSTDANLELSASGTGEVLVPNNNVRMLQDLTVDGTIYANSVVTSNSFISSDTFSTGNILIEDNFITTTNTNSNLELRASGTGSIDFGTIQIKDNTISTVGNADLIIGSGDALIISSTGSLVLPSGTTAQQPATSYTGSLRFNTDINDFEGYNGTNWTSLGGVFDTDRDTYITAELTPGANDGAIRFYTNGSLAATLDSTGLETPRLEIDNILIENSTISSVNNNTDINIEAQGTGGVVLENFRIAENTITNTVPGSNTEIVQTGNGYLKFGDTEGFVIPVGTSIQRPGAPVVGVTRFNTTDSRVEVYDGQNWVSVAGSASGISRADAEDLALEIVLSLG